MTEPHSFEMSASPLRALVWVVEWHSGDGVHAHTSMYDLLKSLRYHPERECTVRCLEWESGKLIAKYSLEEVKI